MKAVTAHGSWLTGKAITITRTDLGLDAIFLVGVFRDDLAIAIEPTDSGGAVLSFRSAARSGRSDLGLNRKRGELLLEAIRAALGE